ncbi:hypothetical protein SteCoe_32655 [Stentor coeruleus]|uniref:Uncharacterized protein n=1 Tax=Stentor coeruleus TaxID=5963 RepID=A0A1R2AYI7_9CILI|nr:hypothetical protein SteCoe_32655 [Stentor coeruleus]
MNHLYNVNRLLNDLSSLQTGVKDLSAEYPNIKKKIHLLKEQPLKLESFKNEKFNQRAEYKAEKKLLQSRIQSLQLLSLFRKKPTTRILRKRIEKKKKLEMLNNFNRTMPIKNKLAEHSLVHINCPQIMISNSLDKTCKSIEFSQENEAKQMKKKLWQSRIKVEIGKVYRQSYLSKSIKDPESSILKPSFSSFLPSSNTKPYDKSNIFLNLDLTNN